MNAGTERERMEASILVVDDDVAELRSVARTLRSGGLDNVIHTHDSREVMGLLAAHDVAVLLLDLAMPHVSGEEILRQSLEEYPQIPVIIVTGFNDIDTAVRCIRSGAFDYMVKPVEKSRMISGVRRAVELHQLRLENTLLRKRMLSEELERPEAFAEIVTGNPQMRTLFRYVETVSTTQRPVLITGETGTGKELFARAVHALSGVRGEFVAVNIAGLDDNVLADTLFGHTRGAFTDAHEARKGLIEQAAGGTFFLDEIGDLSIASQVKLLRLLQEREYFPLGSDLPKRSDARILLATNRDLDAMLDSGEFRKDLFFRLQTHRIEVPPLRERLDDVPLLVDHFLGKAAGVLGRRKPTPPRELLDLLGAYHYPGNVRELEALVFDAVSKHTAGVLSLEVFRAHVQKRAKCGGPAAPRPEETIVFPATFPSLQDVRRVQVAEALRRANGNQAIAAEMLGISRTALNKWLKRRSE